MPAFSVTGQLAIHNVKFRLVFLQVLSQIQNNNSANYFSDVRGAHSRRHSFNPPCLTGRLPVLSETLQFYQIFLSKNFIEVAGFLQFDCSDKLPLRLFSALKVDICSQHFKMITDRHNQYEKSMLFSL